MRRPNLLRFTLVASFGLLVGHGIAAAQAQGTPPRPPPAFPDITTGLTRQVNLTPAEQLTQGDVMLARMDSIRNIVNGQLSSARSSRDIVKTLCLNDKLNQIDVAVRSARERRTALEASSKRNDTDLSTHEYTILSVLRARTDQLMAEATQCIGQEAGFIGESAVSSTIDPNIPKDNPSPYPDVPVVVEPPSCSSCIK